MTELGKSVAAKSLEAGAIKENLVVLLSAEGLDGLAVETQVNLISNSRSHVELKGS